MKRVSIGLLSAVVLLAGAEAGLASFKTGSYSGTTSQKKLILFEAKKKKVTALTTGFTAPCGMNTESSFHSPAKINKKGVFTYNDGYGWVVKGKLKGSKATGTMRFNYGACDTGKLTWKAKRAS